MRVVLVCRGAQNLAIEALVPALKNGGHDPFVVYDPGLFDDKYFLNIPPLARVFDQTDHVVNQILAHKPDLVGFSVMTNLYHWALSVAEKLKSKSTVPIVFGGIHPGSAPEVVVAEKNVDFVVQGEGDEALCDLADSLQNNEDPLGLPNIWTKQTEGSVEIRPLVDDLDSLAPMDKTVFMDSCLLRELCLIVTSRGCPYACAYCCHSYLKKLYKGKGPYLRRRSVEAVVEECERLKTDFDVKIFSFMDDVFTIDPNWLDEFLTEYKNRINRPFLCNVHTRNLSFEVASALKEAGCSRLDFGIQSMNETTRREVLNRKSTNEEIERAVEIFDRIGLPFHIHHIFGLPNDTQEDYEKAARFYHRAKQLMKINCFFLSYFPGTEILNYALSHELLSVEQAERFKHGEDLNYYQGGSLPGIAPETLAIARNYEKLFILITLVPKSWTRRIIEKRCVASLRFIPSIATLLIEVVLVFFRRNQRVLAYMKYYRSHAWRFLKRKFRPRKIEV